MSFTPFAQALLAASLLSVVFATLAWRRRTEAGARPLVAFNLAVATGTGAYAFDIATTTLGIQVAFAKLWLVAQAFTVVSWLYVAIEYTGRNRWASRRTAVLIALEPIAFTIAIAVPPLRRLLLEFPASGLQGSVVHLGAALRPLWFVHFGYLFVVMLTGSLLFLQLFVRSRNLYRVRAAAVVVAAVAPWSVVFFQSLGFSPNNDPSAIAWAIVGYALTVGLYRFPRLDPVPAAQETVVRNTQNGVVVLGADDLVGQVNPQASTLLDVAEDEAVGHHVGDVFEHWDAVATDGVGSWTEFELDVEGETRYVEAQVTPVYDYLDERVGRILELRDVTERRHREQRFARYKTVFETVQDRVFVLDGDDCFLLVNEPLASFLGYEREDLIGEQFDSILAPDTPESVEVVADGAPAELRVVTADGQTVPVETERTPIEFGDTHGSVGYIRDISERKRTERDLATTSDRLETLVDSSPLAVVVTDQEGVVERWNPAAEKIFGYDREAVVGQSVPILPDEQREFIEDRLARVMEGEAFTDVEVPLERKDGTLIDTSVAIAPNYDDTGAVIGTLSIIADITDRKERERKLEQQNQRLEEFASVVSHDLRNPLQVASGNAQLAVETGDTDQVEQVIDALDRMEHLIDDVLDLARQGEDINETEPVELDAVVETAWANVRGADATLEAFRIGPVDCDGTRVTELFENLFRNAVEHSEQQVTIRVGPLADGFYVADDGPGIPPERREDVFDTGHTTHPDGTGFGLAIVRRIAEAHDWSVTITESEDGGARFEFRVGS